MATETIDTDEMEQRLLTMRSEGKIHFGGRHTIPLTEESMTLRPLTVHERHANAMTLTALDEHGTELFTQTYFSVGGGFIVTAADDDRGGPATVDAPLAFLRAPRSCFCSRTRMTCRSVRSC